MERGLWDVALPKDFFVSGEHFAKHCAFEGGSRDDVLPKEFLCRENISWNRDVGCGTQGRGTENEANMHQTRTQNGSTWARNEATWHPKSINIEPWSSFRRPWVPPGRPEGTPGRPHGGPRASEMAAGTVSYTHLTLPTIYSV